MRRAIELSARGYPAPNPHVGCVVALAGTIVGEGWHDFAGGPHAELMALDAAGADAKGADVFVTLEPCRHYGRTPPCTLRLIEAGVRSVTVACLDPNPVAGGGLAELTPFGIRVASGLEVLAAEQVNRKWLTAMRRQSPYVIAKVAISLDGRIALATGESRWITGESARNKVHQLRAECGAVLVGRKTAELDRAQLTVRTLETQNQPTRIVLDPAGQLPLDLPIFDSQAPTLWMVSNPTRDKQIPLPQDGVPGIVGGLFRRGLTSVLVEGGATTISQFIAAEAVDELCIFVAPKLLGNGPSWFNEVGIDHLDQAFRWRFDEPVSVGDDLLIRARPVTSTASNR